MGKVRDEDRVRAVRSDKGKKRPDLRETRLKFWEELRADSERLNKRNQKISETKKGVPVPHPSCKEDCKCGRHDQTENAGWFKNGMPPPTSELAEANRHNFGTRTWEKRLTKFGPDNYGGEFTYTLRSQIWDRDENKCAICHLEHVKNSKKLVVHHIDFDKTHNELDNLILLCRSCHAGEHTNFDSAYDKFLKKKK